MNVHFQRAIKRKITSKGEKHNHWLEYASDKYDMHLINDIKRVLAVAFVFIPLPAFWALYDQQVGPSIQFHVFYSGR